MKDIKIMPEIENSIKYISHSICRLNRILENNFSVEKVLRKNFS